MKWMIFITALVILLRKYYRLKTAKHMPLRDLKIRGIWGTSHLGILQYSPSGFMTPEK